MGSKTSRIRRTFTPRFKRDAVRLLDEGKTATEVARDLGIARSLLQRWKDQLAGAADADPSASPRRRATSERVRELERRLRDVTEQRDILKKALAYFADDQK
jgi:transposase